MKDKITTKMIENFDGQFTMGRTFSIKDRSLQYLVAPIYATLIARIELPHSTGVTVISRAHPDLGIFLRRFDLSLKTSDLSVIQREALFMQIM